MQFSRSVNQHTLVALPFFLVATTFFAVGVRATTPHTDSCVSKVWNSTGLNYPQAREVCENATPDTSECVIDNWNLPDRPFISDIIAECK